MMPQFEARYINGSKKMNLNYTFLYSDSMLSEVCDDIIPDAFTVPNYLFDSVYELLCYLSWMW